MSNITLTGFKELEKELEKLPLKIKKKVANKSVRAGANVVKKDARRLVPRDSGDLRKHIKVKRLTNAEKKRFSFRKDQVVDVVHVEKTKQSFYAHMVEFGHKLVRNKKDVGHVAAQPFMRPAFDNNINRILARMKVVFLAELGKYKRG